MPPIFPEEHSSFDGRGLPYLRYDAPQPVIDIIPSLKHAQCNHTSYSVVDTLEVVLHRTLNPSSSTPYFEWTRWR